MAQFIDLTGETFGRLTVLWRLPSRKGKIFWSCLCVCGARPQVCGESLRSDRTRSCGCLSREAPGREAIDRTGQVFGELTVRCRDLSKEDVVWWTCDCSCGAQLSVRAYCLQRGSTTSCGHICMEDLSGQQFGRLTAKSFVRALGQKVRWLCDCECGGAADVLAESLKNGRSTSCGCYQRERARSANTTHGQCGTAAYVCWMSARRRERKRRLDCGWTPDMAAALDAFQPECVVCGSVEPPLHTDHVLPLYEEYGLEPGNAVRLCAPCNRHKWKKMPEDLEPMFRAKVLNAAVAFKDYWVASCGG